LIAAEAKDFPGNNEAERLQNLVYAVGKRHPFSPLKSWFDCLYQVLLGQTEGPRFGGFIALYGVERTVALIEGALARAEAAA
jgi:lysyl-tRNA synthetase class 1